MQTVASNNLHAQCYKAAQRKHVGNRALAVMYRFKGNQRWEIPKHTCAGNFNHRAMHYVATIFSAIAPYWPNGSNFCELARTYHWLECSRRRAIMHHSQTQPWAGRIPHTNISMRGIPRYAHARQPFGGIAIVNNACGGPRIARIYPFKPTFRQPNIPARVSPPPAKRIFKSIDGQARHCNICLIHFFPSCVFQT